MISAESSGPSGGAILQFHIMPHGGKLAACHTKDVHCYMFKGETQFYTMMDCGIKDVKGQKQITFRFQDSGSKYIIRMT